MQADTSACASAQNVCSHEVCFYADGVYGQEPIRVTNNLSEAAANQTRGHPNNVTHIALGADAPSHDNAWLLEMLLNFRKEDRQRADEDRQRVDEDRQRANEDRQRAEEHRQRAEEHRQRAEEHRQEIRTQLKKLQDTVDSMPEKIFTYQQHTDQCIAEQHTRAVALVGAGICSAVQIGSLSSPLYLSAAHCALKLPNQPYQSITTAHQLLVRSQAILKTTVQPLVFNPQRDLVLFIAMSPETGKANMTHALEELSRFTVLMAETSQVATELHGVRMHVQADRAGTDVNPMRLFLPASPALSTCVTRTASGLTPPFTHRAEPATSLDLLQYAEAHAASHDGAFLTQVGPCLLQGDMIQTMFNGVQGNSGTPLFSVRSIDGVCVSVPRAMVSGLRHSKLLLSKIPDDIAQQLDAAGQLLGDMVDARGGDSQWSPQEVPWIQVSGSDSGVPPTARDVREEMLQQGRE